MNVCLLVIASIVRVQRYPNKIINSMFDVVFIALHCLRFGGPFKSRDIVVVLVVVLVVVIVVLVVGFLFFIVIVGFCCCF